MSCFTKEEPGIIIVPCSFVGRYRDFDICLSSILAPAKTKILWKTGVNIAHNLNNGIREMFTPDSPLKDMQWVWILGDDHTFDKTLLMRLLSHDVDVVVPLVLHREAPYLPVLYSPAPNYIPVWPPWFNKNHELQNITSYAVGNAGMLIKKKVFEKIPGPWFEVGRTGSEVCGSDLYFCEKVRSAGFSMWMDLGAAMGHISHVSVWPAFEHNGHLAVDIRDPDNYSVGPTIIGGEHG